MSLIWNLARLLDQNLSDYAIGTNIFVEEMAADPANAVMLVSSTSPQPDQYLNTRTLDFEVWGRNDSTKTGNDVLAQAIEFLHRRHHDTLGDYYVYFIGAIGDIENLGKDIEGRSLQKVNFRAIYIDRRTIS